MQTILHDGNGTIAIFDDFAISYKTIRKVDEHYICQELSFVSGEIIQTLNYALLTHFLTKELCHTISQYLQ